MTNLSIVIEGAKISKLKGLKKIVPYAVVLPHTMYVTGNTIKGLALYDRACHAHFEMTVEEFKQLEFSFVTTAA